MADKGDEKLLAVARHIARTLGRTDTMADDILDVFTTFDDRFSRHNLSDSSDDDHRRTLLSLDHRISHFVSLDRPVWSDSDTATDFLAAVDSLLSYLRDDLGSPLLDRADDLLHRSMLRLEDEFRAILDSSDPTVQSASDPRRFDSDTEESDVDDPIPVANPVSTYDVVIDAIPPGSVADLRSIAERMCTAGFGREIAHAYSLSRRDFLDESLSRLGVRRKTDEDIRSTPWNVLEDEIQRWVRAANLSFRVLFPSERRLCEKIFPLQAAADLAFVESVRGSAAELLGFADSISSAAKSPERLFRTVDMYETLRHLLPEIDPPFADQFDAVYKSLGTAIRGIFMELENLIRRDPAKAPVPGGGLHPITRYVMNYLRAACGSRRTLEEVMSEDCEGVPPADDLDRPSSSLSVQMAWILEVLQGNLDLKSKIYNDPSLSLIFLMNNGSYIISKAKDSEIAALMGEDWMRRQSARVRKWAGEYQKATWSKVAAVLKTDAGPTTSASARAVKERFRVFNAYLEGIWREQKEWVVVDERLKEGLRVSAAGLVIPAYRSFVGRWGGVVGSVKYGVEDVEVMIHDLFEGRSR
ncbi:putative exocyst complex component EXO70B1 [Iris pallida]|uniref:Exocyst subunit Exo70 family protein n=1 Tax=Iris pallida TaxID=29817 RepID=A0AAX6ER64_IRIPA|nr:putative exocyst complex component EXO70B1 [Iris pallida]